MIHVEPGTVWKSNDKRETRYVRVFSFDPVRWTVTYFRSGPDGTHVGNRKVRSMGGRFVLAFTLVTP